MYLEVASYAEYKVSTYAKTQKLKLQDSNQELLLKELISQNGISNKIASKLIFDILNFRKSLETNHIAVPEMVGIGYIDNDLASLDFLKNKKKQKKSTSKKNKVIILEQFVGPNLYDLIRNNLLDTATINIIIKKIHGYINRVPTSIFFDSHPGNFTYFNNNLFYIDYLPPKFLEYQKDPDFVAIFPNIEIQSFERQKRRIRRYYTKVGRLARFHYYLKKVLEETLQFTTQHFA